MFGSAKQLFSGEIYLQNSVQEENLGVLGQDQFGDLYRYGAVGASNISAGKLSVAPTPKTNHHNVSAFAAVTADGKQNVVTLVLGATAATLNEYAGGILNANAVAPAGQSYRITSNPAANSSANLAVTVATPFTTSITTSSKFSLTHNTMNAVIEGTVQTKRAAGVPQINMTALYYGWFKIRGTTSVLADGTIALGSLIAPSGSVSGAVIAYSGTWGTALVTELVGQASILAGVDTEYRAVDLRIR